MQYFKDFQEAVDHWNMVGGAMCHYQPRGWHVGTLQEVDDACDVSAKEATEAALLAGGLSHEAVAYMLAEWQEI